MTEHLKPMKLEWTFQGETVAGEKIEKKFVFEVPTDLTQHVTMQELIYLASNQVVIDRLVKGQWTIDQLWDEMRAQKLLQPACKIAK